MTLFVVRMAVFVGLFSIFVPGASFLAAHSAQHSSGSGSIRGGVGSGSSSSSGSGSV